MDATLLKLLAYEMPAFALLAWGYWYDKKNTTLSITTLGENILKAFKAHEEEDHIRLEEINRTIREVKGMVGRTKLTNEQIIEIARSRVWLSSEKKIDFIRKILTTNDIKRRKEQVKRQIKVELTRRSQEYISFLNQFVCSEGLVGDWVGKNFPMDEFLEEIYVIVFREDTIDNKVNDVRFIMMSYQNELWEKFKNDLK